MRHVPISRVAKCLGVVCDADVLVGGYQIDSRRVEVGDLFFALPGAKVDGHQFLREAAERGAIGAVVSKGYGGSDYGLILISVEDVVGALQALAAKMMEECKAVVVGITGSLGKTTVKEFCAKLLEGRYRVGKTWMNYNSKLTVPITVLNRVGDEEILVVEMGMGEPGDLKRLVEIVPPDIGVVTKVAWVHGAYFPGGVGEIAKNKMEIFSHPKTKKAIFDHELYQYAGEIAKEKVSFSFEERTADYFLSKEFFVDERGVRAYQFEPPFRQSHILHNFLAAVSVARELGMSWDEINQQVAKLELPKMRFEVFDLRGVVFVNDAYNASPDSMRAALSNMPEPKEGGKRIAVLGMMVEMGEDAESIHKEVGQFAQKYIDHLLVIGKEAGGIYEGFLEVKKPAEHFLEFESLAERLKELMNPGDVVLLKGSRKVELEKLLSYL